MGRRRLHPRVRRVPSHSWGRMRPSRGPQGLPRWPGGLCCALGRVRPRSHRRVPRRWSRRPGRGRGSDRAGLSGIAVGCVRRSEGTSTRHRAVGRRRRCCRRDRTGPGRSAGVDDRVAGGVLGQPPHRRYRLSAHLVGNSRAHGQSRETGGPTRTGALHAHAGGSNLCSHHRRRTRMVTLAGSRADRRGASSSPCSSSQSDDTRTRCCRWPCSLVPGSPWPQW